jgi:hypothetical protein
MGGRIMMVGAMMVGVGILIELIGGGCVFVGLERECLEVWKDWRSEDTPCYCKNTR